MQWLLFGALALAVGLGLGQLFVHANPAALARVLRRVAAILLVAAGVALTVVERPGLGFMLVLVGLGLLGFPSPFRFRSGLAGTGPASGRQSTIETAVLRMSLDHDTGALDGVVKSGPFAGRHLSTLTLSDLLALRAECAAQDGDGLRLLEAYLDRSHGPAWRNSDGARDGAAAVGRPGRSGAMTEEEALAILGLERGAGIDDIKQAHRRLMMKVHPDQGGSDYLAAKINQAKDTLMAGR